MSDLDKNKIDALLKGQAGSALELLKELNNILKTSQDYAKIFDNPLYQNYLSRFTQKNPGSAQLINDLHQQQKKLSHVAESYLKPTFSEQLNKPLKK